MSDSQKPAGQPLQLKARQVSRSVYVIDFLANVGIRVGGLFVVFAVLGMVVFIVSQVVPLFVPASSGVVHQGEVGKLSGATLFLHCDEYRRTLVRLDDQGNATVLSALNGEVLSSDKLDAFKDSRPTAAWGTTRSTETISPTVDKSTTVHLLVAGTANGEVWQGSVRYLSSFMRVPLNPTTEQLAANNLTAAEWDEVKKLERPEEEQTKDPRYAPKVVLAGPKESRVVIEHQPKDFQFYRRTTASVALPRRVELPTEGAAIVDVCAAAEVLADHEKPHEVITAVITAKGAVLLAVEALELNPMTEAWGAASSEVIDLTTMIDGKARFVRVNANRDVVLVLTEAGRLYNFERAGAKFKVAYDAVDVFKPVEGTPWLDHVNNQRAGRGYKKGDAAPRVTAIDLLFGDVTLLIGDSAGGVQAWFAVKANKQAATGPFNRIHIQQPGAGGITSFTSAQTHKSFLCSDDSGMVRAIHNTAEREYFNTTVVAGALKACSPLKEDGFIAVAADGSLHHWWIDAPHPDVSLGVLMAPVWYEDYREPINHWESTGPFEAEHKFGLMPLIIGTLKGGLYALLVAIPLALLGAVYTSEFMHRKIRSVVKPSMEIMASLPSVVLGFLAAMYFAPEAAPRMATIIVAVFLCPGLFLLFGWVFQQLPPSITARFGPIATTATLFVVLITGLGMSGLVGPRVEQVLFPASEASDPRFVDAVTFKPVNEEAERRLDTGDFRRWTGGGAELPREGDGSIVKANAKGESVVAPYTLPKDWWIPGGHNLFKLLMWIPLALLIGWVLKLVFAGTMFFGRELKPLLPPSVVNVPDVLNTVRANLSGGTNAGLRPVVVNVGFSLGMVAIIGALGLLATIVVAPVIEGILFNFPHPTAGHVADFRRFITGPEGWKYTQTNSLIVGFAMGFAVIPIIYSIAEDALTTVPNHLRAASLACGASRWQTTTRIVVPAAASGIFSAIVIGLGRAVGETMIVVMAAGGTPVMDFQPLVGFRSLSAAIATEISEAADASSHRRVLFLGGLVLFLMTFLMSTLAEFVRMRLRKKLNRM